MTGGRFQGANKRDFSDAANLYAIIDTLEAPVPHEVNVAARGKYRYVRYLFPPNSKGNVAEIYFLSKEGDTLKGIPVASEDIFGNTELKKVFDGDPSVIWTPKKKVPGQWIGLDLGSPDMISMISFCPRTDKNNVWKGLCYELLYWDSGWKSLGTKKAKGYGLTFEYRISDALYLLRCLDEGREGRIFTYENGEQV